MARSPRRPAQPLSEHYGDLVRVALMEARPAGLHTVQLVAATRLKQSQVQRGIRHLRDVGAAENLTPITWGRKDGYMFSDDPAEWIEYEKKQLAQALGRLTGMITARSPRTWPAAPTTNGPNWYPPSSPGLPRPSPSSRRPTPPPFALAWDDALTRSR
jgi:hypothetical protein